MPTCPTRTSAGTARAAPRWAQACCSRSCCRWTTEEEGGIMGIEIERKFLLNDDGWRGLGRPTPMRQGYLASDPVRTVRVRIEGERAVITIKSKSSGATRGEWEYEIPVPDAVELLDRLCEQPQVEKTRHRIDHAGHTWEVDEFHGDNAGLVVAEIDLDAED